MGIKRRFIYSMGNDLNGDLFHLIRKRKQKEMGKENQATSVKTEETKSPSGRVFSLLDQESRKFNMKPMKRIIS